ncbi:MAG: 4-alpha-glucanotransferase [Lachnospiraceae bacterium]|nr:4-alpha-glucanotransferase [Lachnospiraceae bacterium]
MIKRGCGILLPITSLPSKHGIGCFSKEAYEFVDFLSAAGQRYWQILPLGPTGFGDSPYQSFSTFAGNPYLIDLGSLMEEGLLTESECNSYDFGDREGSINYEKIYRSRFQILFIAFQRSNYRTEETYQTFVKEENFWLEDYATYMAIKQVHGGASFLDWEKDLCLHKTKALKVFKKEWQEQVEFYKFLQYNFYKQWKALKTYANERNIKIIGDIPIYVALDSADTWSHPELFQLGADRRPKAVAGCPPDAFSKTGQLWGNPLYDWKEHRKTKYAWWILRVNQCQKLYDVIRVDHFRGFESYYAIPYGDKTAEKGNWQLGPGLELFKALEKDMGKLDVIAEDLGFLTDGVRKMVKESGFPGMKVLQFAFNAGEDSGYLPHHYKPNCVVYTGTHDNDTTIGWAESLSRQDAAYCMEYLGVNKRKDICKGMIRIALSSVARTVIIPMQDYLEIGSEGRINLPSTLGENWKWRLLPGECTKELSDKIKHLTDIYARNTINKK